MQLFQMSMVGVKRYKKSSPSKLNFDANDRWPTSNTWKYILCFSLLLFSWLMMLWIGTYCFLKLQMATIKAGVEVLRKTGLTVSESSLHRSLWLTTGNKTPFLYTFMYYKVFSLISNKEKKNTANFTRSCLVDVFQKSKQVASSGWVVHYIRFVLRNTYSPDK